MIRYLGKRYDVLMVCIAFGRPFTCTEVEEPPKTIKGLADDGYLSVVRSGTKRIPYLYSVPDRIRRYYGDLNAY